MRALLLTFTLLLVIPAVVAAESPALPSLNDLMKGGLDEAEEFIESFVDEHPDHAEAHYMRGAIMGMQASDSIFSALGYAKKSLSSFQRAVELEPESVEYRQGLISFYMAAPGIAGGDMDKAWQHIQTMQDYDAKTALQMELAYWQVQEDEDKFKAALNRGLEKFSEHPDFYYRAGLMAQEEQHFDQAHDHFDACIGTTIETEMAASIELNCLYQVGRTALFSEQRVADGIAALEDYQQRELPNNVPGKEWAKARLAALYLLADRTDDAQQLVQTIDAGDDENLAEELESLRQRVRP
ncbi:MAG TPA: hypothetical protein VFM61_09090 [Pseudidiomarina sp.]|nr:hypothetical protein [Pseudidiomarina sp.]